ncbi:hypothetical protein O0I10_009081 [Lichtheimia ornata]|uniref:Uncharacterized protein n=1 Tax=Lichtheimia ornata TaxID=688661 RepID=A0AAD7UY15_9FUNG|nr:uncharacterized protein O0I10_009081 [Lichtheimia ornata]KAJ8655213.1 hypothetical protein O0I10_009081 [Lichtheimia ornata]
MLPSVILISVIRHQLQDCFLTMITANALAVTISGLGRMLKPKLPKGLPIAEQRLDTSYIDVPIKEKHQYRYHPSIVWKNPPGESQHEQFLTWWRSGSSRQSRHVPSCL